jgi:hypothetical protein
MILEALMSQIEQRFSHEKRARVCLFFDEKRELSRIIPALVHHLAQQKTPPFQLLAYDAEKRHGQIWLRHSIQRALTESSPASVDRLRFVLYIPLPEERLDVEDNDGMRLDLLEEYRVAGVTFRIGGKRPTLFGFLRQAGVKLPEAPSEQRRLYDGGRDSLLAKYVAKFVDRPAAFWETAVTPELVQARLVGDADQTIFEWAADPDGTLTSLRQKGLEREFLEAVRDRYGSSTNVESPQGWIHDFVALVALTETFLGYGEPAGFPFVDRLPPVGVRTHHVELLQRWLRDTEYRPAWDRQIEAVEAEIDLSAWALAREGRTFGFPHLVKLRCDRVLAEFEAAAAKTSTTAEFFQQRGAAIAKEAELAKASAGARGAWKLLADVRSLIEACEQAERRVDTTSAASALVAVFVDAAGSVEARHIDLRSRAEELGLATAARVADRAYASYTNELNNAFFKRLSEAGTVTASELPHVTAHLEQTVWNAKGRRAVVIVDALRYDCALAIKERLHGHAVSVEPVLAMLPTVTAIGMTALLPISKADTKLEISGNTLRPRVNGKDMSARANRLAFLETFGAQCRDIDEIEKESAPPAGLGELLVVYGHEEVDSIGHGQAETLIRHVHLEIDRLARVIRKLHRWGYGSVHVVTDHGFILLDESKLPDEVPCDKDWCHVRKERFAMVPAGADIPLVSFPIAWDPSVRVAVPPGLAFFQAEKSFSHGGAAVSELVIPHLISRGQAAPEKRIGIEVVLPTSELLLTSVKVTLRATTGASPPGQISLFSELGRTLLLDVVRAGAPGPKKSVLAGKPKEVRLDAKEEKERSVTLFFQSAASFRQGELLELDIRDVDTLEQFPPGGIKLTVGRDM